MAWEVSSQNARASSRFGALDSSHPVQSVAAVQPPVLPGGSRPCPARVSDVVGNCPFGGAPRQRAEAATAARRGGAGCFRCPTSAPGGKDAAKGGCDTSAGNGTSRSVTRSHVCGRRQGSRPCRFPPRKTTTPPGDFHPPLYL